MSIRARPNAILGAFAACAAASCTAPDPLRAREWFEIGAGVFEREQRAGDPVDDAFGPMFTGGYDLTEDFVRSALEIGASASAHDVASPPATSGDQDLEVWRVFTGLRLEVDVPDAPLSVYARAGWFWRDEDESDLAGLGNDQWGNYAGVGLDWWYGPGASLGPFLVWTRGREDDLEELQFGLAARFYVAD